MAAGRRGGTPTGLALATFIALGIGLHNLGEGLAIGAAFAAGAAGLGTFLVLGFTLHNITEGIGIAAPILKQRPPLRTFAALTLLAGGPAVVGLWIGSLAYAPQWSALALAVGAGAILQVIVELVSMQMRQRADGTRACSRRARWPDWRPVWLHVPDGDAGEDLSRAGREVQSGTLVCRASACSTPPILPFSAS